MNTLIYFCILLISILMIYLMNKFLNTTGLKISIIFLSTISLILSFKLLSISNLDLISNSITYVSIYTALYLLIEKINTKEINKIIIITLIINIFTSIILYITSSYTQTLNDTVGINMTNVFIKNYRILISYPITTAISMKLTQIMYKKIKSIYNTPFISTTTTYLSIGLVDITIYILISYLNLYETKVLIKLLLSTYMIRLILTVSSSLFLMTYQKKKVKK